MHISFVRSLDLDSFSDADLKKMFMGGNQKCVDFFGNHDVVFDSKGTSSNSKISGNGNINGNVSSGIRERYHSDAARLYREVLKARVEGRSEPTMADIGKSQGTLKVNHETSSHKGGVQKMGSVSSSTAVPKKLLLPLPSMSQCFIGGIKYWTYRYIVIPLRHNRRVSVSLLATYVMTKMVVLKLSNERDMIPLANIAKRVFPTLMFSTMSSIVLLSCLSTKWFQIHRQEAFKSAINDFQSRVNSARSKRNPMYDLYFPPNLSVGSQVDKAVIFFQDLLVDKSAYATIMGKLSDAGILVVVVNLEPLRLSGTGYKGLSPAETVLKIGFEINKLLGIQVEEWILMSHGEGACAVTNVIRKSPASARGTMLRKPKIVLLSPTMFMHDLSKVNVSALVVNSVGGLGDDGKEKRILMRLPNESTTVHNVVHGDHSGFAHYGPATFRRDPLIRKKSLDELQKEVQEVMLDFLLSRESSLGKKKD